MAIPGLGTLLCGKARRGLLILGLSVLTMFVLSSAVAALTDNKVVGIGIWPALGLWVWGIVDGYRSAEQWNAEHPPQAGGPVPPRRPSVAAPPARLPSVPAARPAPPAANVDAEFDADGKVTRVSVPQQPWTTSTSAGGTFRTQRAGSLLAASEILKKLSDVPGLTYYVVETPDGNLGRDKFGFYTEAPVKTSGIRTGSPSGLGTKVQMGRLTDSGESFEQQRTVANLGHIGKYARLVLLMECGRCGYESPVETESGPIVRQCYCCGATNTGARGSISVILAGNVVVEI